MTQASPISGYGSWAGAPLLGDPALERPRLRSDTALAMSWVAVLICAGVAFSFATRPLWFEYTFSYRVSWVYVPIAFVSILFLAPLRFPVAAAIYYGYLPIGQPSHAHHFLAGDVSAALTFEMVLALPLVVAGLFGGSGQSPRRATGRAIHVALWGFVGAGFVAALLSGAPGVCLTAWTSRFLIPALVTLVLVRRLRSVEEYRTVWYGLVTGLTAVCVFDYRRAVLGEVDAYVDISQRYIGLSQSVAIPLLFILGGALWLSLAQARRGRALLSITWLAMFAAVVALAWLGASRGALAGLLLLGVWWLPNVVKHLHRPSILIMVLVGGLVGLYLVRDALTRTTLDVTLAVERLRELEAGGLLGHNRAAIWAEGLRLWSQQPIFGRGPNFWVTLDTGLESVHGTWIGLLFDTGLLGTAAFVALVIAVLRTARRSALQHLSDLDRTFVLGCRAGWVVMLLILCTNLPFTSGQPRNHIHAYVVFLFPALALVAYQNQPHPTVSPTPALGPLLPPSIAGTAHPRPADFMP